MSKHNNSNGFNFEPGNKGERDNEKEAAQFDLELERLLQAPIKSQLSQQPDHSEMLKLAMRLHQEAPSPVRPNPAFVARLSADLRQRAQAQKLQTTATNSPRKWGSIFGLGWRLGGGMAWQL